MNAPAKVVSLLREMAADVKDGELSTAVARIPDAPLPAAHIAARLAAVDLVSLARLNPPPDMRHLRSNAGSLLQRAYHDDVDSDHVWRAELAKVWMPPPAVLSHANLAIAYALCPGDDATERSVFHCVIAVVADAAVRRSYVGEWATARTAIVCRCARTVARHLVSPAPAPPRPDLG